MFFHHYSVLAAIFACGVRCRADKKRQPHRKLAPLSGAVTVGGHAAIVQFHEAPHQRQTNSQSTLGSVDTLLGLCEQVVVATPPLNVERGAADFVPN